MTNQFLGEPVPHLAISLNQQSSHTPDLARTVMGLPQIQRPCSLNLWILSKRAFTTLLLQVEHLAYFLSSPFRTQRQYRHNPCSFNFLR